MPVRFPTRPLATNSTSMKPTPDDDFVEDSEPEREEVREVEKRMRRERRELRKKAIEKSVIEISSDTSDESAPVMCARPRPPTPDLQVREPHSIIVITDESDQSLPHQLDPVERGNTGEETSLAASADSSYLPTVREILGLPPKAIATSPEYFNDPSTEEEEAIPSQSSALPPPDTQMTAMTGSVPATQNERPLQKGPDSRASESSTSSSSVDGSYKLKMHLAKFAYVRPTRTASASTLPSARSTPASRSASVISLEVPGRSAVNPPPAPIVDNDQLPKTKQSRKATSPFTTISNQNLEGLLRCVSCDLAWTARKTAAQKLKHIVSCARKTGLTEETVDFLIRQELEKAPADNGKTKGKGKNPEANEVEPQTLLAGTLHEVEAAAKRKKRGPVKGTVRELAETRTTILERARALLAAGGSVKKADSARTNQVADKSSEINESGPPLTQPFGDSALAARFQSTHALFQAGSTQSYVPSPPRLSGAQDQHMAEPESPPRTQPFGTSALAARFGMRAAAQGRPSSPSYVPSSDAHSTPLPRPYEIEDEATIEAMLSADNDRAREGSPNPANLVDTSSSVHSPFYRCQVAATPSIPFGTAGTNAQSSSSKITSEMLAAGDCAYSDSEGWQDDAVLHYNPDQEAPMERQIVVNALANSPRNKTRLTKRSKDAESNPGEIAIQPKKTRKTKAKTIPLTEAEVHARLKEHILADKQLYLRILRYEPISLDLFMDIVNEEGGMKVTKSLKDQVIAFLDKQAISFYDHTPGQARTRTKGTGRR